MNIEKEFESLKLFTECENGWTRVNNQDVAKIKQFIKEKIKEVVSSVPDHCQEGTLVLVGPETDQESFNEGVKDCCDRIKEWRGNILKELKQ